MRRRAEGSEVSRKWLNDMGLEMRGKRRFPDCLAASMAVRCHFSRRFSSRSSVSFISTRSEKMGTMAEMPISMAFWMIDSMPFALGIAWARIRLAFGSRRGWVDFIVTSA